MNTIKCEQFVFPKTDAEADALREEYKGVTNMLMRMWRDHGKCKTEMCGDCVFHVPVDPNSARAQMHCKCLKFEEQYNHVGHLPTRWLKKWTACGEFQERDKSLFNSL